MFKQLRELLTGNKQYTLAMDGYHGDLWINSKTLFFSLVGPHNVPVLGIDTNLVLFGIDGYKMSAAHAKLYTRVHLVGGLSLSISHKDIDYLFLNEQANPNMLVCGGNELTDSDFERQLSKISTLMSKEKWTK